MHEDTHGKVEEQDWGVGGGKRGGGRERGGLCIPLGGGDLVTCLSENSIKVGVKSGLLSYEPSVSPPR